MVTVFVLSGGLMSCLLGLNKSPLYCNMLSYAIISADSHNTHNGETYVLSQVFAADHSTATERSSIYHQLLHVMINIIKKYFILEERVAVMPSAKPSLASSSFPLTFIIQRIC